MTTSDLTPAVFLDRDGTINKEVDYLARVEDLVLLPGAARAIALLNQAGLRTIVISNQSGVARGLLDEKRLAEIHERMRELLALEGAHLDAIYYCPHHPTLGETPYRRQCDCRKPLPGLYQRAAREHPLDLARSWAIGDSARDLEAAAAVNVRGLLVATGKPMTPELRSRYEVFEDLLAATQHILATR